MWYTISHLTSIAYIVFLLSYLVSTHIIISGSNTTGPSVVSVLKYPATGPPLSRLDSSYLGARRATTQQLFPTNIGSKVWTGFTFHPCCRTDLTFVVGLYLTSNKRTDWPFGHGRVRSYLFRGFNSLGEIHPTPEKGFEER